jgi:chromosomal replication initiation ATPase DnaA
MTTIETQSRRTLRDACTHGIGHLDSPDADARTVATALLQTCKLVIEQLNDAGDIASMLIPLTAGTFEVKPRDLIGDRRGNEIIRARHAAMYLFRRWTAETVEQIGRRFNRDHSTVCHGAREAEQLISIDEFYAAQIRVIEKQIEKALVNRPARELDPAVV